MHSYWDSSVLSIIEDFGSHHENKGSLELHNELSLLTAITEILDGTDEATLSPFDTIADAELLASPREQESCALQLLGLSQAPPERDGAALEDQWGPWTQSSSSTPMVAGKAETEQSWDRALSCQEDAVVTPKRVPSQARWGQRKPLRPWAQEQPALQRSDGEEEDDEAPSPRQDGSTAMGDLQMSTLEPASAEAGAEPPVAWLGEGDVPCIISPAGGSLCDLVKSMHPYCLPAFATDLDAAPKPSNKDLLAAPAVLGIVSGGDGQSLETPVVFPLLPAGEEGTAGGEGHGAPEEPLLAEGGTQQHQAPTPALGSKATGQSAATPKETLPTAPPEAGGRDRHLQSDPRPSTEAPAGGKCQGSGWGRGRERARKSRKKKSVEALSTQVRPLGDSMASRLRSASSVPWRGSSEGQTPALPPPSRATHPSAQVSNFLAEQLEQARKDAQLDLRPSHAPPRPRGRPRGSRNRRSCPEPPREPEVDRPMVESRAEQAVPSPKEQEAAAVQCGEEIEPAQCQASASPEPAPGTEQDAAGEAPQRPTPVEPAQAENQAATCPPREARPKALSLTEYRRRMQHRAPGAGPGKEPEKQAAGKWPSIPEPPTELAEIPCLVAPPGQPLAQPAETPGTQKGSEKPAGSPPASKAPPAPALTTMAPAPPAPQLPFVPPPVTGAAPAGVMSALATPYTVYPPMPSWPCFGPPPSGFPLTLLPPPAAASPNAFRLVPGLPPTGLAWPPPAVPPPPPFGPGAPYAPMGWSPALPPPYWPSMTLPQLGPPLVFADPSSAPQSPALGCSEPAAFAALPTPPFVAAAPEAPAPAQAAPHAAADQPPAKTSRASDPRRQAQPVERPSAAPAAAAAQAAKELLAATVKDPQAAPAQATVPAAATIKDPPVATAETAEELPAAATEDPPAAAAGPVEEPPTTRELPPACPPAKPARSSPGAVPAQAHPAPRPPAGRETVCGRATGARDGAKPPAARPWRHRPLARPAQPSGCEDIVQAFISEIGIEASDLSSLLEQFEKTEAKKEESGAEGPKDKLSASSMGVEPQQDKKSLDSLQAPELANVAGLTPPATPPHQLWKPLAAVSLLAKPWPVSTVALEGAQKTTKLIEAQPLPHGKPRGKPPPAVPPASCHVGAGDHDYCFLGGTGTPELGSRWNVKHHADITIKPITSLAPRTQARPGPSLPAASAALGAPGVSRKPLDHRTSTPGRGSPPASVLLSPDTSPCRDKETRTPSAHPPRSGAKRAVRCYRVRRDSGSPPDGTWRRQASRSFSASSNGGSEASSSSSSSSSRSRSRSSSPPPKRWRRYRPRCSSRSRSSSPSSAGSCGSSRSSSSSSYSSRSRSRSTSRSRSRSRSLSPCRRHSRRRRYSYDSQDHYQRQRLLQKERAIEERRVVFIGKIPGRMTCSELRHRFSVFGDIEECTLHFRSEGDNYGFVTYRYAEEAFAAIERGHTLRRPDEQPFDLCFGGRRQFCRRNYADLDSNREDFDPAPTRSKFDSLDFDTLLKQAQRSLRT
ncbi:PREDICTED: peroxisome proliferator-activated receptor gamma coactivator-related protein 1 isoform X2 [Crocodylus porosus]|uniref:Peroxisome proliferator-activated receptor gamma coactivator-related protein 1 n=1 Tax=Crocodylus porosus TaxID=8502 RepID=A0A7M4F3C5_CROPO|nr:PREDICTED: peroxisome proliferator-activated receptor gamma coactivator-related protein 1 isoform X2 [Crocodylus porosus]